MGVVTDPSSISFNKNCYDGVLNCISRAAGADEPHHDGGHVRVRRVRGLSEPALQRTHHAEHDRRHDDPPRTGHAPDLSTVPAGYITTAINVPVGVTGVIPFRQNTFRW